jgi:hypothetical protein
MVLRRHHTDRCRIENDALTSSVSVVNEGQSCDATCQTHNRTANHNKLEGAGGRNAGVEGRTDEEDAHDLGEGEGGWLIID